MKSLKENLPHRPRPSSRSATPVAGPSIPTNQSMPSFALPTARPLSPEHHAVSSPSAPRAPTLTLPTDQQPLAGQSATLAPSPLNQSGYPALPNTISVNADPGLVAPSSSETPVLSSPSMVPRPYPMSSTDQQLSIVSSVSGAPSSQSLEHPIPSLPPTQSPFPTLSPNRQLISLPPLEISPVSQVAYPASHGTMAAVGDPPHVAIFTGAQDVDASHAVFNIGGIVHHNQIFHCTYSPSYF